MDPGARAAHAAHAGAPSPLAYHLSPPFLVETHLTVLGLLSVQFACCSSWGRQFIVAGGSTELASAQPPFLSSLFVFDVRSKQGLSFLVGCCLFPVLRAAQEWSKGEPLPFGGVRENSLVFVAGRAGAGGAAPTPSRIHHIGGYSGAGHKVGCCPLPWLLIVLCSWLAGDQGQAAALDWRGRAARLQGGKRRSAFRL